MSFAFFNFEKKCWNSVLNASSTVSFVSLGNSSDYFVNVRGAGRTLHNIPCGSDKRMKKLYPEQ